MKFRTYSRSKNMAARGHKFAWLAVAFLHSLCIAAVAAQAEAHLEILPSAYLPEVTQSVQFTCRPSHGLTGLQQVVTLEVFKLRAGNMTPVPVASYVTSHSPAVEALGAHLGVSASGSYDPAHPAAAFLSVTLPRPTNTADGLYSCAVHWLDSTGLLHNSQALASLLSLAQNCSVPDFYHSLLKELRNDLNTLTSDLDTVQRSQDAVIATDADAETKLTAINGDKAKITELINDVNKHLNLTDVTTSSLLSQLDKLRSLTPETPVAFYAYLSSTSGLTYSSGARVPFNAWGYHSDDSYSVSTGIFTAPVNGTYFFRAALAWDVNYYSFAALTVNGDPVASLFAYDDYNYPQASASAVVELDAGDAVSVVKRSGNRVYGAYSHMDHVSYFMGMLLW